MSVNLPETPRFSRRKLEKMLSDRYFKKPYDRFMWWRSYTLKNKPLDKKASLRDKILNGDFDQGPFLLEIELAKHTINDKWLACMTTNGEPDHGLFHGETSIDRARIKRLREDFEKDETNKLETLKKEMMKLFRMDRETYDDEVVNTSACDLINFYYKMEEKYKTPILC